MFIGLGGGIGHVKFSSDIAAANRAITDDSWVGEYAIGYRFDTNVVIEGGGSVGMSLDTLLGGDFFTLHDNRVIAGYVFELGERFSFVPEIGFSFWDIEVEDGVDFFIFGSERGALDASGRDVMMRLSGEWHVGTRFRLYASYVRTDVGFGDFSYPSVGFTLEF